jgi:hypothetical protein
MDASVAAAVLGVPGLLALIVAMSMGPSPTLYSWDDAEARTEKRTEHTRMRRALLIGGALFVAPAMFRLWTAALFA